MTRVLHIRELHKQFTLHNIDGRTVPALRGVSLDVHAGEHVALAGASGAGKSSLLKCVYRTYVPTAGTVLLTTRGGATVDLTALPDRELATLRGRELGYVSQFLRPHARRSPFEIVVRAAEQRGLIGTDARGAAAAALRRLHLDEALWDVYASVLSGGQQQRVNLAAGTVSPPRLLLLDEPVSALDPENREAALALIGDLTAAGVAVLSVFHDLDAIRRLASRVVVMRDGVIADQLTGVAR